MAVFFGASSPPPLKILVLKGGPADLLFKGIVVYNLKILVDLLYIVFVKNELVKLSFMGYQNTQQRSPHFWFFNIFSLDLQGQKLSQRLDNKTPSEKFANHFFVLGVNILFGLRKKNLVFTHWSQICELQENKCFELQETSNNMSQFGHILLTFWLVGLSPCPHSTSNSPGVSVGSMT